MPRRIAQLARPLQPPAEPATWPTRPARLAERVTWPTRPARLAERVTWLSHPGRLAERATWLTRPGRLAERVTWLSHPGRLAERVAWLSHPGRLAERVTWPGQVSLGGWLRVLVRSSLTSGGYARVGRFTRAGQAGGGVEPSGWPGLAGGRGLS